MRVFVCLLDIYIYTHVLPRISIYLDEMYLTDFHVFNILCAISVVKKLHFEVKQHRHFRFLKMFYYNMLINKWLMMLFKMKHE